MVETNWCGELVFEAADITRPQTIAEVQDLVRDAPKVKALGTRHSFSRIADSPGGLLLDMTGCRSPISVDHESMTATVPGGASYSVVAAALEAEGVALPNLASLPHITVAGATATGTHGSGDTNQVLSAHLAAVELVTADGSIRWIDRTAPEFPAVAVGLGAFGIITRVTVDVEPSYQVAGDIYLGPRWDVYLDDLDDVMGCAYSVNVWGRLSPEHERLYGFWAKTRLEAGSPEYEPPAERFGAQLLVGPSDNDAHTIRAKPGPWSQRLAHFRSDAEPSARGDELQSEFFVDRAHAVPALHALRAIGQEIDPHLRGFELRTVAADDLWMSPAYGRDTFSIGCTWQKKPVEVRAVIPRMASALSEFDARPHLGKLFSSSSDELHRVYPRLGEWLELVDASDPDRKFDSPVLSVLRSAEESPG